METTELELGDVSATSLVTLFCRAVESESDDAILDDPKAVEVAAALRPALAQSADRLGKRLAAGNVDGGLAVHIALRAKRYDEYVRSFLDRAPEGVVVSMGCGMDSRFGRIDNGRVRFFDLDLPPVIDLKSRFFEETDRYRLVPGSVLDHEWMDRLDEREGPFLFVAEGVFMYLEERDVRALVLELQKRFPGSELLCEVFNSRWLSGPWKAMMERKMRRRAGFGEGATFRFGIRDSGELERWGDGIELLDDWSYFDADEKKLGSLRLLRRIDLVRKTQWTVHYRLG